MTRRLMLALLAMAVLLPFRSRAGCIATDEAGFPHAQVQRFPANIKGVLFQVPTSWTLAEQDFDITSPDAVGSLRPQISPIDLAPDSAASRELPPDTRLVRVSILGRFRPGSSYTVRYTGQHPFSLHYPSSMTFAVDTDAVDFDDSGFKVVLAPDAVARMHTIWSGDDGVIFAAATRGVTLQLPPALDRYRQAISFFHEQADVSSEGMTAGFRRLYDSATACNGRGFGAAHANRLDVAYRACGAALAPAAVRSSAAFLEVDDRVVVTGTEIIDWGPDMAVACSPAGQVRIALDGDETRQAWRMMCDEGMDPTPVSPTYDLGHRYLPTAGQFEALAQANPVARTCTVRFMGAMLSHGRDAPPELAEVFVRLAGEVLAAEDGQAKHRLLRKLATWTLGATALRPLLPQLQRLAGQPEFRADATAVLDAMPRRQ